jgi:TRAP-type C4-dicarboxylate transport system permease small subunit
MRKLRFIFDNIEELISVTTFVIMTLLTITNVFTRYLENYTIPLSDELSRYCFMWMTFFGAALCTKHEKHIVIDFLINSTAGTLQKIMKYIVDVAVILLMVFMVYYGLKLALVTSMKTSTLGIPMSYILYAVPFSCALILIRTIEGMVNKFKATVSEETS